MHTNKSVLILDSNQRSSLAATRSLGSAGYKVFCADVTDNSLAGCSKYCINNYIIPCITSKNDYINSIITICKNNNIKIVLPMTDRSIPVILENVVMFSNENIIIPFADLDIVNLLSDKSKLIQLANEHGIQTPKSFYATSTNFTNYTKDIQYPVVLKPFKSIINDGNRILFGKVTYAISEQELVNTVSSSPVFKNYPFLIQEYIHGRGEGLFVLFKDGEFCTAFSHRRLKEKPPRGGVSVLSRSQEIPDILLSQSISLLESHGWHGVAMLEYKVTDSNVPYLMEINTRFWGSLQLAIDSGVNFPLYLCNNELDIPNNIKKSYNTHKYLRWIIGDLDRLIILIRSKDINLYIKIKEILNFIISFILYPNTETFRTNDILPFIYEVKDYIKTNIFTNTHI